MKLYAAIAGMERVLVRGEVSSQLTYGWQPAANVFSHMLIIWNDQSSLFFAIMHSTIHGVWTLEYASTLGKGIRYTPSDCFDTFLLPQFANQDTQTSLEDLGNRYYSHRQTIMQTRQEGLTKTYNRFHNSIETSADITELRRLHVKMDEAVTTAYGWQDLDLAHGFHETKQGIRYTISESARREVLDRLLELNHQRYAEEVAAGLHDKKPAKTAGTGGSRKKQAEPPTANEPEQFEIF